MSQESILSVFQNALEVIIILVLIVLLPALIVGLIISIFQAATQINEMTLSFIPKLIVIIVTLMIGGPWMLQYIVNYCQTFISGIPELIG